jgi:hypothetical protein
MDQLLQYKIKYTDHVFQDEINSMYEILVAIMNMDLTNDELNHVNLYNHMFKIDQIADSVNIKLILNMPSQSNQSDFHIYLGLIDNDFDIKFHKDIKLMIFSIRKSKSDMFKEIEDCVIDTMQKFHFTEVPKEKSDDKSEVKSEDKSSESSIEKITNFRLIILKKIRDKFSKIESIDTYLKIPEDIVMNNHDKEFTLIIDQIIDQIIEVQIKENNDILRSLKNNSIKNVLKLLRFLDINKNDFDRIFLSHNTFSQSMIN